MMADICNGCRYNVDFGGNYPCLLVWDCVTLEYLKTVVLPKGICKHRKEPIIEQEQ
jgi:hypothetical protein